MSNATHTPGAIPAGPWTVEAGRQIVTPIGTFYLSYEYEPRTGKAGFPDFCALDRIAHSVAALPELLAALREIAAMAAPPRPPTMGGARMTMAAIAAAAIARAVRGSEQGDDAGRGA